MLFTLIFAPAGGMEISKELDNEGPSDELLSDNVEDSPTVICPDKLVPGVWQLSE